MAEARFQKGQEVTLRQDPSLSGTVLRCEDRGEGQFYYQVFLGSSRRPVLPESDLVSLGLGFGPEDQAAHDLWGSSDCFLAYLTLQKLRNPMSDLLYSYQASRTDLLPHQFIPLLKVLESPHQRILIADEVGLGKTIEAGLIMAEQRARGQLRRALVVCQGSLLMNKWAAEMRNRFDEKFEIFNRERLEAFLQDYREGRDPELRAVASLPFLRQPDVREKLEESGVTFDLTIIDEAHRLKNRSGLAYRLGQTLASQSHLLLMLTATPLHLGNEDLFSLLHLLDPVRFANFALLQRLLIPQEMINQCISYLRLNPTPMTKLREQFRKLTGQTEVEWLRQDPAIKQIQSRLDSETLVCSERIELEGLFLSLSPLAHVFTRTRRADLELRFAQRTPVRIQIQLIEEEQNFLDGVEELARDIFRSSSSQLGAGFASIMLRRQAASSLPGAARYLRDILEKELSEEDFEQELSDLEVAEALPTSFQLDTQFHSRVRDMLRAYKTLIDRDTKYASFWGHLQRQLGEGQKKFVLFSFFKRTLHYLADRLRDTDISAHLLTGDIRPEDREGVVEAFRKDSRPCILLSSEVGGEGLDFQFASVMFNYDLPWNPMVVEQRIGRIDRYGQQAERIVIFNFSVAGTIEERIFERLYDRIEIFRRSIGDLEAILGEELSRLTQDILKYKLTPEEEADRTEKIANGLLRRESTLRELEKEGSRVSGDDSYFFQRIGEVRSGKRFLQAEEMERLVLAAIRIVSPGCKVSPVAKRPGIFRLHEPQTLSIALGTKISRDRQMQSLLQQLAPLIHSPEFTFRSDVAQSDRDVSLITSRHPLVELLKQCQELDLVEHGQLSPTGALQLPGVPQGEFLVFLFLMAYQGFRKELVLTAIPVTVPQLEVHYELSEQFLTALSSPLVKSWSPSRQVGHLAEDARKAATSALILLQKMRIQELQQEGQRLVALRKDSLSATYQKRCEQISQQLELQSDERILRMHRSRIDNLHAKHQTDLAELHNRSNVHCQENLIGIAYCVGLGEA